MSHPSTKGSLPGTPPRGRVVVVDHGSGNLRSVSQAVMHVAAGTGVEVLVSKRPEDLLAADRVVLPGQGALHDCMQGVADAGLMQALREVAATRPLMGVCVGMQMMFDRSEEGPADGMGLVPGEVLRFRLDGRRQPDGSRYKIPQMGWNRVWQTAAHPIWAGVEDGAYFYFLHSYHARPSDPRHTAGETEYGDRFTCAVARDNIFATQFHPEKSAADGLRLYRNFLHWNP